MKTYHFIYCRPEILEARWSHLHRFVRPSSRDEIGWVCILGANLDISHHTFASLRAKDWTAKGSQMLSIRYDLIESLLQVGSHQTVIGFAGLHEFDEEVTMVQQMGS
jgi:hypothetical protein